MPGLTEVLMRKPITPFAHGVLDYSTATAVAMAPTLPDFPESAEKVCYALAGSYSALSLLTDYPLAAKRVVPFKAHGATEGLVGAFLPVLPWMLGFARHKGAR